MDDKFDTIEVTSGDLADFLEINLSIVNATVTPIIESRKKGEKISAEAIEDAERNISALASILAELKETLEEDPD
jgi:hypothetical protein